MSVIASIEVLPTRLRLREPFAVAYGTHDTADTVLVRLRTDDGIEAWGEATPDVHVTGETYQASIDALAEVLGPAVIGMRLDGGLDAIGIDAIVERCDELAWSAPAARAAIDIAAHDAAAQRAGLPLWRFLEQRIVSAGGIAADKDHLLISRVVSMLDPDAMADAAVRHVHAGFSTVKLKVGEPVDWTIDVERVAAVRRAVGPGIGIKVDANQGWRTADVAVAAISGADGAPGIAVSGPLWVEQPVVRQDLDALAEVRRRVPGTAIMADEAVCAEADVERVVALGAADLVNLKLMKTGGLHHAIRADRIAAAAGMRTQVGTMVESSVASAAGLAFAMASANVATVEMGGPLMIADDPGDLAGCYHGERVVLTDHAGLGITMRL
ncbi:MAG TPA: enolase C-terminal domain-like protein [Microthrixaceae bacterium]|nr:enolase C-terminal domain-like protein [Microthrixaceae bacterium]